MLHSFDVDFMSLDAWIWHWLSDVALDLGRLIASSLFCLCNFLFFIQVFG